VAKVVVQEGQHVSAHEPLIVLEAMKMEHVIEAPHDGVVMKVLFREGELVPAGSPVVEMGEA
jgi:3-methylcrotonyl-CoA carboxylase alpha subunit